MSDARKPRRPAFRDPAALEELGERHDPIAQLHAAHETAAALLGVGRAAHDPAVRIEPAAKWDGDFLTSIDLYITRDKRTCLVCHEAAVGMPKDFKKINPAEHLEEQGASEPASQETCFECHGGHNTAP